MKKNFVLPKIERRMDVPKMEISLKTGLISFNVPAVKNMNISLKDSVGFFNDVDNLEDWFIAINPQVGPYPLRKLSSYGNLGFGSRQLVNLLSEFIKINPSSKRITIPISKEFNEEAEGYPLLIFGAKVL